MGVHLGWEATKRRVLDQVETSGAGSKRIHQIQNKRDRSLLNTQQGGGTQNAKEKLSMRRQWGEATVRGQSE